MYRGTGWFEKASACLLTQLLSILPCVRGGDSLGSAGRNGECCRGQGLTIWSRVTEEPQIAAEMASGRRGSSPFSFPLPLPLSLPLPLDAAGRCARPGSKVHGTKHQWPWARPPPEAGLRRQRERCQYWSLEGTVPCGPVTL